MTTTNRKYVTLSFQHNQQTIFEVYEPYEPEFDSPHFHGSVSLAGDYDPDWYQSSRWDASDTEISFDWSCNDDRGNKHTSSSTILTNLENPDELSSIRHITNIFAVDKDLYLVELS